jgi:hypothetical protein
MSLGQWEGFRDIGGGGVLFKKGGVLKELNPLLFIRGLSCPCGVQTSLKGHGNEADFLGVLYKSVRHRFLTLHFKPF